MSRYLKVLILAALCAFPSMLKAQENPTVNDTTYAPPAPLPEENSQPYQPPYDWKKRFFTGGGIGLQFGSYTYIGVFPIIGYRVTEKFSVGTGFTYIYAEEPAIHYSTSVYGGKFFAEYDVFRGLAPHIEYEFQNLEVYNPTPSQFEPQRVNVNSLLIGVSYTQQLGENSGVYIQLLYNVIEDIYSPYENPILRVGFNVGL
jgi:long-subunit fatty acid transport protein